MTTMHKTLLVLALAAIAAVGTPSRAAAIPIVSIDPTSLTVVQGAVDVDITVSDLAGATITGFSFLLDYNDLGNVLTLTGYDIGASLLPDPAPDPDDFSIVGTNSVDFFYSSLDSFAALDAAQGDSFTLVTLHFTAVPGFSDLLLSASGSGFTPLTQIFATFDGGNASGNISDVADLNANLVSGSRCVTEQSPTEPCGRPVPEPASMMLVATGVAALVARRRLAKPQA